MLWMLNSFTRTQASGPTPWTTSTVGTCSARCTDGESAARFPIAACCLSICPSIQRGSGRRCRTGPSATRGRPVIDVDRGGKITWHGPGQLTAYPIIKLREPMDVVAYVRALEEAMIRVCAEFGLQAIRVEGRSGAWLPASRRAA